MPDDTVDPNCRLERSARGDGDLVNGSTRVRLDRRRCHAGDSAATVVNRAGVS